MKGFEFDSKWATRIVVVFGGVVALIFALRIEGCDSLQKQQACKAHVTRLVQSYRDAVAEDRFDATLHGSAQILSWLGALKAGDERMLFCPEDPDRPIPKDPNERRAFHPAGPDALRAAIGLGSYAVRDFEKFPVKAGDATAWIVCDRQGDDGRTPHHQNALVVALSSGVVLVMTRKDLKIDAGDDIVVGPTSTHPELKKMEQP
jgi:hypothetical protein